MKQYNLSTRLTAFFTLCGQILSLSSCSYYESNRECREGQRQIFNQASSTIPHADQYEVRNYFSSAKLQSSKDKNIQNEDKKLKESCNILEEYNVEKKVWIEAIDLFSKFEPNIWPNKVNELVVSRTFLESKLLTREKILEEMFGECFSSKLKFKINEDYEKVFRAYESKPNLIPLSTPQISKLDKEGIKKWSEAYKNFQNKAKISIQEVIAITIQAAKLHNGYLPRDTQLISIIAFLNKSDNQGRLLQINTGEGKSLIVALLAAIKALQGEKVDVVTTSTELSIPEVEKQKDFFSMLGLSVGENSKDAQEAYKKDIVYGTPSNFQGDILRTEFMKYNTRGDRGFHTVIVDEVDSMLFDERNNTLRLSTNTPGLNHIEEIMGAIWSNVNLLAAHTFQKNNKYFHVTEDFEIEGYDITLFSQNNPDECIIEVPNLYNFLFENTEKHISQLVRILNREESREHKEYTDLEFECSKVIEQLEQASYNKPFLEDKYKKLTEKINKCAWHKHYPILKIPTYLKEFANKQFPKWIKSSIHALISYKYKEDYVIGNGKINPADCDNTGVIQKNMVWGNGLSQMLQFKEGLPVIPDSICTNYISNASFFKRYGNNICGLTGTLGNSSTKDFFSDVYRTDMLIIPAHKLLSIKNNQNLNYLCKELVPVLVNSEEIWYKSIVESTVSKANTGRAVLIICQYITNVDELQKRFLEVDKNLKIFTYTGEGEFKKHTIDSGEIIIATNIAGRGTDFSTSEAVEKTGGLHVCMTFLPKNYRVEMQAAGRTGRMGKRGTAQLVLYENRTYSLTELKNKRNANETASLKKAKADVKRQLFHDDLFKQYCCLEDEVISSENVSDKKKLNAQLQAMWELSKEKLTNIVDLNYEFLKKKQEFLKEDLELAKVTKEYYNHIKKYKEFNAEAEAQKREFENEQKNLQDAIKEFKEAERIFLSFKANYEKEPLWKKTASDKKIFELRKEIYNNCEQKYKLREEPYKLAEEIYNLNLKLYAQKDTLLRQQETLIKDKCDIIKEKLLLKKSVFDNENTIVQQQVDIYNDHESIQLTHEKISITNQSINGSIDKSRTIGSASNDSLFKKFELQDLNFDLEKVSKQKYIEDKIRDGLQRFCENRQNIYPADILSALKNGNQYKASNITTHYNNKNLHGPFERSALQERWGLWRMEIEGLTDENEILESLEAFANEIRNDAIRQKIIKTPYYFVLKGNSNPTTCSAEECYDKAIELDNIFCSHALYNKAIYTLKKDCKSRSSLREAKKILEETKSLLRLHIKPAILSINAYAGNASTKEGLYEHIEHKCNVVSIQESSISSAISEIEKALNQSDWELTIETISLKEALANTPSDHSLAIGEFENNGLIGLLQIAGKEAVRWGEIVFLAALGVIQVAAGVCMLAATAGTMGTGLIMEGISDIVTAVKAGYYGENISWKEWGIQKAASLAISVISAGWQHGKKLLTKAKEVGKATLNKFLTSTTKEITTKVALECSKGALKEVTFSAMQYGYRETLGKSIHEEVFRKVDDKIKTRLINNTTLLAAIQIDIRNKNNYWQNIFLKEGERLLQTQYNAWGDFLSKVGKGVALENINLASEFFQLAAGSKALYDLIEYTDGFLIEFSKKIEQNHKAKINKESSNDAKKDQIDNTSDVQNVLHQMENGKYYNSIQQKGHESIASNYYIPSDIKNIIKSFTAPISSKLNKGIDSAIVNPIIQKGSNYGVTMVINSVNESVKNYKEGSRNGGVVHSLLDYFPSLLAELGDEYKKKEKEKEKVKQKDKNKEEEKEKQRGNEEGKTKNKEDTVFSPDNFKHLLKKKPIYPFSSQQTRIAEFEISNNSTEQYSINHSAIDNLIDSMPKMEDLIPPLDLMDILETFGFKKEMNVIRPNQGRKNIDRFDLKNEKITTQNFQNQHGGHESSNHNLKKKEWTWEAWNLFTHYMKHVVLGQEFPEFFKNAIYGDISNIMKHMSFNLKRELFDYYQVSGKSIHDYVKMENNSPHDQYKKKGEDMLNGDIVTLNDVISNMMFNPLDNSLNSKIKTKGIFAISKKEYLDHDGEKVVEIVEPMFDLKKGKLVVTVAIGYKGEIRTAYRDKDRKSQFQKIVEGKKAKLRSIIREKSEEKEKRLEENWTNKIIKTKDIITSKYQNAKLHTLDDGKIVIHFEKEIDTSKLYNYYGTLL